MDGMLVAITLVALLTTIVMAVVAWTLVQEERRRSDARVAALADELDAHDVRALDEPASRAAAARDDSAADPLAAFPSPLRASARAGGAAFATPMFAAAAEPNRDASERLFPALVTGAVLMTVCLAVVLLLSSIPAASAPGTTDRAATAAHTQPIELVSMSSEAGEGRIHLTGVIRNRPGGAVLPRVTAVASFFSKDGAFLGSSLATLTEPLRPGEDRSFSLVSDVTGDVARYRVSFRGPNDSPLSHVDRREGR